MAQKGHDGVVDIGGELPLGRLELEADHHELLLEHGNQANAAVDGVAEAGLGLVVEGADGRLAIRGMDFIEELGDVGRTENLDNR